MTKPYPPEPFRIKVTEPIRLIPREAREGFHPLDADRNFLSASLSGDKDRL